MKRIRFISTILALSIAIVPFTLGAHLHKHCPSAMLTQSPAG